MYKKEQKDSKIVKQPTNLFSLLDDENDTHDDSNDNTHDNSNFTVKHAVKHTVKDMDKGFNKEPNKEPNKESNKESDKESDKHTSQNSVRNYKNNVMVEEHTRPQLTNNYKSRSYAGALEKNKSLHPVQQTNHMTNNIEDEMFKHYYGRKIYKNVDNKRLNNEEDGFKHVGRRKDKQIVECKFKNLESDVLNMSIGNYYKVLGHHNDDQNWDYISYHNICTLTKWKDIPQLFNTLNKSTGECKFTDFDIFIMKNDISPMWEDLENRNGSICSIKVDSLKEGYKILRELLVYTANNTLMEFSPESWDKINGLSFSPKRMDNAGTDSSYCVIIKIWFKQNYGNNANIDKYLNPNIQELLKRYSVKVKSIKPEY
jgi:hypothetical protein